MSKIKTLSVSAPSSGAAINPSSKVYEIDPSQILTLREVAERLKVSERWVYEKTRRRSQNPLPVIRIGRYLRFHWLDVSAWLRKNSSAERAA